jgi:hypothetical protein
MAIRSLMKQAVVVGLLALSGCEAARSMRNDLARLTTSQPTAAQKPPVRSAGQTAVRPKISGSGSGSGAAISPEIPPSMTASAPDDRPSSAVPNPATTLTGKSESEVRALLGAPTSEEERPPGKRWHYRNGQCTVDVQLYPDVQTKQFGTLAYEVRSDDNTDEGKRLCLAQLQSRVHTRN